MHGMLLLEFLRTIHILNSLGNTFKIKPVQILFTNSFAQLEAMNYLTRALISASPATVLQSTFKLLMQEYIICFWGQREK